MIPYAVEFSMMISVVCYGWPISFRVIQNASSSLELYNNTPHSTSTTDDITLVMMVDMTIIDPFGQILSLFAPTMKKNSCSAPCL